MYEKTIRLEKMYNENETAFKCLLDCTFYGTEINVLTTIRNAIVNAGIDEMIYKFMEDDILKGNFSVIYLDDRVIGEDKKRQAVKKQLEKLRGTLSGMRNEGIPIFEILFER